MYQASYKDASVDQLESGEHCGPAAIMAERSVVIKRGQDNGIGLSLVTQVLFRDF